MADIINLTPVPINITTVAGALVVNQPIVEALDVSAYDLLDLVVVVQNANQLTTVNILTSMTNKNDDVPTGAAPYSTKTTNWFLAGSFSSAVSTGGKQQVAAEFPNNAGSSDNILLRYVRWQLSTAAAATVSCTIMGMARRRTF